MKKRGKILKLTVKNTYALAISTFQNISLAKFTSNLSVLING